MTQIFKLQKGYFKKSLTVIIIWIMTIKKFDFILLTK